MLPPIRGSHVQGRSATPRRATLSGFALPGGAAREAVAADSIQSHLGVLGLQEALSGSERDAAATRRGAALLRELEALQISLLGGPLDAARLNRLALLAEGEMGADPALQEIMAEISLRARIEWARVHP